MARVDQERIGRNLQQILTGGTLTGLTDRELLDRSIADPAEADAAFAALLDRHGSAVLGVCRGVLGADGTAEDAFQATFLALARSARSIRVGDSLRPWLLAVARRTAAKGQTGAARRRTRERAVARAEAIESPPSSLPDELAPLVRAEVDRLPARYRDPVRLFYLEGRTHAATAEALGWPVGSVSRRLSKARQLLRTNLARRGITPLGWLALPAADVAPALPPSLRLATLAAARAVAVAGPITGASWLGLPLTRLALPAFGLLAGVALLGIGSGLGQRRPIPPPAPPVVSAAPILVQPPAGAPPRVDQYGDPLPDHAIARLGTTRFRQSYYDDGGAMLDLRATPDGRTVITSGQRGGVSVWDRATGRRLRRFDGDRAALAPDGQTVMTLVSKSNGGQIRRLAINDGRELARSARRSGEQFSHLTFAPDGRTLLALSTTTPDPARVAQLRSWLNSAARVLHVTPPQIDDEPAYTALVGLDPATLAERFRWAGNFLYARALAYTPDGRTIAIAVPDRVWARYTVFSTEPERSWIVRLDAATGRELGRTTVDRFDVAALAFSPDGRTLAAGIGDRTIRLYDSITGVESLPRLNGAHAMALPPPGQRANKWQGDAARAASALAFAPDGRTLVAGLEPMSLANGQLNEPSIVVWDVVGRREVHRMFGHYGGISGLAFFPDGRRFASTGGDPTARVWDVATGRESDPRPGHRDSPHLMAISPLDGTVLTAGVYENIVLRWDARTGQCLGTALTTPSTILDLAVAPDGRSVLADTWEGLTLWDLATCREVRRFTERRPSHTGFYHAQIAPNGQTVTMELQVWEVATGKRIADFTKDQPDWPVRPKFNWTGFTPDSRRLVAVESPGIRVLDIATATVAATPVRRENPFPDRAAISPDGTLVAVGNFFPMQGGFADLRTPDLPVRVYEISTGREVATLTGHTNQITALAFAPNGRTIATAAGSHWHQDDRTVRVWDATTGRELKRFDVAEAGAVQVAYLPDGRTLVSLGLDGVATVWDIADVVGRGP